MEAAFGDGASVRVLNKRYTIEIQDLDEMTEEVEVVKTLVKSVVGSEPQDFMIHAIRTSYSGTKRAVVVTTAQYASTPVKTGKIRVG